MSRDQIGTFNWLKLKANTFKGNAEEIWWHAANSYGRKDRVGRLINLRSSAEELIEYIDKAIEEQEND